MTLQEQLMQAIPKLTERDFATHATDLYVVAYPEVTKWLKENYEWWSNVTHFTGQRGSDWNGSEKPCYDIPFACWKALDQRSGWSSRSQPEW